MKTTRISLVRHGQVHNPLQIYYGRLPRFRLSAKGREQAAQAAAFLHDRQVTAVYTSPLLRARQTAGIIATTLNVPLHRSRLLLEAHSMYNGRSYKELHARNWDIYTGSPPEFEQPHDIAQRMQRKIGRVRRAHQGQHAVLVSHADPIAWTVLWAAGRPLTVNGRDHLRQAGLPVDYPTHACVITLSFYEGVERPYAITYRGEDEQEPG